MDFKKLFKNTKNSHNIYLILILLVGVIFMLFPQSDNNKKEEKTDETHISYEEDLERILSKIDGVGEADVMLTYLSSFEKSIAYETNQNNNKKKDGDSIVSEELNSESNVVISSGEPFVVKENYPKVQGVIVAAEGGGDMLVKQNIINAVTAVFSIAPHKVCVVKKSNK